MRYVLAFLFFVGCGAVVPTNDAGDAASGGDADKGEGGWTMCTSPGGYTACGGANCTPTDPSKCECYVLGAPNGLGVCQGAAYPFPYKQTACNPGLFGDACVALHVAPGAPFSDVPFEVGQLVAQNGGTDYVRYADLSLWTGDPLPTPSTCPNLGANTQACGSSCGTCSTGQVCFGGSPLHPVGFCAPQYAPCKLDGTANCQSGQSCFTFTVQSSAQADADAAGVCFSATDCTTLAQNLPGGGKCTAQ